MLNTALMTGVMLSFVTAICHSEPYRRKIQQFENYRNCKIPKFLPSYISFKNADRMMEYCTDVEVNEDNTNKTTDTAIPKLKEVQNTKTLPSYICFKNAVRKMEYCTDVE
uniref:Uncharacterized protein n=1 Tax=Rhodnius prolixus TaxID=13249 RepID=T1I323_RHOPR